jgi:hypothetical protein
MPHCPDHRIQILDARVHTGKVGMDGALGYDDLETSVPAAYRSWNCISTHGPSELTINVVQPIALVGGMNGSMRVYREEGITFSVDGDAIDALHGPWDVTRSLVLPPGKHVLAVDDAGHPDYCHSLWMYRTVTQELATPENTVFATVAAFGANFENATKVFRRSAEHFGFPITFVDQDKEFQGYYEHKIKAMGVELRRQQERGKTFAFLLDCRDIFFLHPMATVLAKFNALHEGRLIFNADFIGETWPVDKIWFLQFLQHLKEKSYVCLNAGFIAGKIETLLTAMEKIEEMRAEFFSGAPKHPVLARVYSEQGLSRQQDDQFWYHLCLALYPELIEVDEKKLLATFIKDFPKREPRFNDDARALDAIGKASVIHGAYPSHHPSWEAWAHQMMKLS